MAEKPLLPVPGETPATAMDPYSGAQLAGNPFATQAITTKLLPQFSETPAGRGEAPPVPETAISAAPPSDPYAGATEVPATDPYAGAAPVTQTRGYDITKLKATPVADLVKDKVEFNPVEFYARNTDALLADPAALKQVEDAYAEREKQKLTPGQFVKALATAPFHPIQTAKTVGKAVKGVSEFFGELGKGVGQVFETAGQAAGALSAGDLKETSARISEAADAFDSAQQRWVTTITSKVLPRPTDIRERLAYDADFKKREIAAAAGNGELARALGTDAAGLKESGVMLNPDAIQKLSVIEDPFFLVPIGGAIGVVSKGGKFLLGRAVGEATAEAFAKVGNAMLERAAGGAIEGLVKGTGKAIEGVGGAVSSVAGKAAGLPTAPFSFLGVLKALPKTAEVAGNLSGRAGRLIQGAAPAAGAIGLEAFKGAAEAGVLSVPLFIGSTPEERDSLLGMVAAGGALRAGGAALGIGAASAARGAQNKLAKQIFESVDRGPIKESPYYGTDQKLDVAHAEQAQKLTPGQQSVLNWTREFFRNSGIEVYSLDNKTFLNHVPQVGGAAAAEGFFTHRGERVNADGSRQPVIQLLLNGDTNGLGHELYHAFKSLDPKAAEALEAHIGQTWHPVEQQWISDQYNAALNGGKPRSQWEVTYDKNQIREEAAAEVFGRVFDATDLSGVKPSVVRRASEFASSVLEKMGYPLAGKGLRAGPGVSALGIRPSTSELKISRDFLSNLTQRVTDGTLSPPKPLKKPPIIAGAGLTPDIAISRRPVSGPPSTPAKVPAASPTPKPATLATPPATPATAPNIRVTPKEQLDYAAKRSQVTNAEPALAEAQKLGDPKAVEHVKAINALMEAGHGVEIVHKGVIREGGPTPEKPVARGERRSEQEAAYIAEALGEVPENIREQHQKVLFGTRWQKTGKSGQQLTARSLDKALANIKVSADMAADAKVAIPYEVDAAGKLTEAGWGEAVQDLKDYWANQDRGFRGDGEKLVRPDKDIGASIPPEDPRGPVANLSTERTDFLNLIQGLNIPEAVTRQTPGKVPGNIKGQLLAEAQGKQPAKPSAIKPEDVQRQAYKPIEGIGTREIAEVNPLRNQLRAAGAPVGRLIEVTENVNLKNIESVTPRPDVPGRGGSTDITRAGFSAKLPSESFSPSPQEKILRNDSHEQTGRLPGLPAVNKVASDYAKSAGLPTPTKAEYLSIDPKVSKRLADFNEKKVKGDNSEATSPEVQKSYRALVDETKAQYEAIKDAGFVIEPQPDPTKIAYKSHEELMKDLKENKHVFFLQTEGQFDKTFSGSKNNPLLEPSGVTINGYALTNNDLFRVVHDFFGHAKEGFPFSARGEFNAWAEHSKMFSKEAQGALAAETLAQNSWVNFGPHLRDSKGFLIQRDSPGYIRYEDRPFSPQRNYVVPENLISEAKGVGKFSVVGKPVAEVGESILKMTPEEFQNTVSGWKGKLTGEAYRLGLSLTDRADLAKLQDLRTRAETTGREAMEAGDFDTAMPSIMKAQFFREAWEAAQGVGSAKLGTKLSPEFKDVPPPFPEGSFSVKRKSETEAQAKKRVEETDYSKYNVPAAQKPNTDKPTGWILPNGKFVSLDTAYHQEWLASNREQLNKEFGTDFAEASSVEERRKAVNAGFIRIRDYGGTTHIELNQKFFKGATKATLEDRVLNNAKSMDRLQVSLLSDKGEVVDSVSAKLIDSENPKEDAAAVLKSLTPAESKVSDKGPSNITRARAMGESFSAKPKGEVLPGFEPESADTHEQNVRAHVATQRREFPEAIVPTHSRDEVGNLKIGKEGRPISSKLDYDLANTPVVKAAAKGKKGQAREEAITDAYAKGLENLYKTEAEKNPDIMAGAKYSTARSRIKRLFGDDSKFFCELLGATSARNPVDVNYSNAVDAYNLFKQGEYDKQISQYRKGKAAWETGKIKGYVEATGNDKPNRGQFLDWWIEKHNLKPRKSNGTLFGANSRQVLRVLDGSWMEEVQGPKTPNFTGNLAGTTFEATIDVWASRTLHRIGNEGEAGRWRILPESEQGISDSDFHLAQTAFRKAGAALGIKPDALQAIVWFAEKDRWQRNGWTGAIGAEKSDFNVHLAESEKLPSGLVRKKEPQIALGLELGDIKKK